MGLDDTTAAKVLNGYSSREQVHSSVEDDLRLPFVVDGDETERERLFKCLPSSTRKAWIASTKGGAYTPDRNRCEIANSSSVDEPGHSKERELRALMTASLDGDGAAYQTLLKQLTGHLRAYYRHRFARIGHGPTEAEDLLQEVLIAVHTHRHTYDRLQPFTPWIHAIARYKFLDYLRRTKSSYQDMPIASAEELTAKSDMAAVESGLDLRRLMSKISSKAREVIQYVKLEGLSVSEAAARCGMSESAVKVAVHRGLKALTSQIRKESEA
ncbi:MAG TPA: sigma-70 family RNA polymerase sigma factor [Candidatus Acidoferrales bacterium]|nr:sigma-70 family RNA polymerase sigma factor [Candidatus Acidoferrales bacterium]